jgi:hypothetical protein
MSFLKLVPVRARTFQCVDNHLVLTDCNILFQSQSRSSSALDLPRIVLQRIPGTIIMFFQNDVFKTI